MAHKVMGDHGSKPPRKGSAAQTGTNRGQGGTSGKNNNPSKNVRTGNPKKSY